VQIYRTLFIIYDFIIYYIVPHRRRKWSSSSRASTGWYARSGV